MEIYLDTAKIEEIKEAASWGVISGVTTNPSLMMRAGRGDYQEVTQEICYIVQGPISAEVVSLEAEGMVEEARRIAQWSPHVVIKVPTIPEGLKAMNAISQLEVDPETLCQGCPWFGQCDTPIDKARDLASLWGVRVNATQSSRPTRPSWPLWLGPATFRLSSAAWTMWATMGCRLWPTR